MKRLFLIGVVVILNIFATSSSYAQKSDKSPKYIFFLIGDGMGHNIISISDYYLKMSNRSERINFTSFPNFGNVTTYCKGNYITDSAAAGTALACGEKTNMGKIGVGENNEKFESIAVKMKRKGMAIGILSTTSIDHATPAVFYAHQPSRKSYYQIGIEGVKVGFDVYGAAGFAKPNGNNQENLYKIYEKAGYKRIKGKDELSAIQTIKDKIVITEREGASNKSFTWALERKQEDLSLRDILKATIPYLEKKGGEKGFFVMAEGAKIDHACHSNDIATAIEETVDFSEAVDIAFEFYKNHTDETLIIVTSDHETGGVTLGNGKMQFDDNIKLISHQKISGNKLSYLLMHTDKDDWNTAKKILKKNFGFWDGIEISEKEEEKLHSIFKKHEFKPDKKYNQRSGEFIVYCKKLVSQKAGIGWTTFQHTGSMVPIYSVGVGSERFSGVLDNTDIPHIILNLLNNNK
jgi:alkaline phosphatase